MSHQPRESRILDGRRAGFKAAGPGGLLGDTVRTGERFEDAQSPLLFFSAVFACFCGAGTLGIYYSIHHPQSVGPSDAMTPRVGRGWWVGVVLAVTAGLSAPAPRASADCATHLPSLGGARLPFAPGPGRDSRPAPRPCNGPNCQKVPADPAPPPAPPPVPCGDNWAWLQGPPAPPSAPGAARADEHRLLTPLFFPSPLERPPR